MTREATLVLDLGGKIVWADRTAHDNVGLEPGGLLGKNYLEFCPLDTRADLLRLHKLKLEGQTVRFRIDLGRGKILSVTSGPVRVEDNLYFYVVARPASGEPAGDEVLVGMLAAGELLGEGRRKIDLNSLLLGTLREEARSLKGKLSLLPGNPPAIRVRPWPTKMVLRRLLTGAGETGRRFQVATGGSHGRAWLEITLSRSAGASSKEFALCRRTIREQGGRLEVRGKVVRLSFPAD